MGCTFGVDSGLFLELFVLGRRVVRGKNAEFRPSTASAMITWILVIALGGVSEAQAESVLKARIITQVSAGPGLL